MFWFRYFVIIAIVFIYTIHANAQHPGPKDEADWLHEGLMLDERDTTFIIDHFDLEPWHESAVDFYGRWQDDVENIKLAELPTDTLLQLYQQYTLSNLFKRKPLTFDTFWDSFCNNPLPDLKWGTPVEQFDSLLIYLNTIRFMESNRGWKFDTLDNRQGIDLSKYICQHHNWYNNELASINQLDLPFHLKPWQGAAYLATGVFLEDKDIYEQGKTIFTDFIDHHFEPDGTPKTDLSLDEHIQLVTGLMVMAEINQRHEDWFWNLDMHHFANGLLNLNKIGQNLYQRIVNEDTAHRVEHWGWLELAYRMYGGEQWRLFLDRNRPIYDRWTGGPTTLTHGRYYPAGTPDFGVADDGFEWLYNKEDLTGWQVSSRWYEIDDSDFYVEDGIVYTQGARDHYLYTDRMYDRFHFKVEYNISEGSNSGVFVWAPVPGRASRTGFEIQLLDDANRPPRDNGSGSLYEVASPKVNAQIPAGEWGEIEIICDDPFITVIMNGQLVHKVNLDEHPETQGRRRNGFIGLQDHAHKVQFRNMRIKLLDES